MANWMHNYPGIAKLVQQEGDVLEGVSQEEESPAAVPRPLWEAATPGRAGVCGDPTPTVWMPASNRALGI